MRTPNIVALFDRNRLRLARQLRALDMVDVSTALGVSGAAVSQFERGRTRPASVTLHRLAEVLDVPLGYFATASHLPHDQTDGYFRSLRTTQPRDRYQALAYVALAHHLLAEAQQHVHLPAIDLPALDHTPVDAARAVRDHYQLPPGPVADVVRTVEQHGILTLRFPSHLDKAGAFSVPGPARPTIVLAGRQLLRDQVRVDAAHELGHLVLHTTTQVGDKIIEAQAEQFAAAFLMPADDITDELPTRADWPHLIRLKARWGVPLAHLLTRAATLGVMPHRTCRSARQQLTERGWTRTEPGNLGSREQPALLHRALVAAADLGDTLDKLIAAAALPEADVRLILDGIHDHRPHIRL